MNPNGIKNIDPINPDKEAQLDLEDDRSMVGIFAFHEDWMELSPVFVQVTKAWKSKKGIHIVYDANNQRQFDPSSVLTIDQLKEKWRQWPPLKQSNAAPYRNLSGKHNQNRRRLLAWAVNLLCLLVTSFYVYLLSLHDKFLSKDLWQSVWVAWGISSFQEIAIEEPALILLKTFFAWCQAKRGGGGCCGWATAESIVIVGMNQM